MKKFLSNVQLYFTDWNKWRAGVTLKRAVRRARLDSLTNYCRYYVIKGNVDIVKRYSPQCYYYGDVGYVWLTSDQVKVFLKRRGWLHYWKKSTCVIERGKVIPFDEYRKPEGRK